MIDSHPAHGRYSLRDLKDDDEFWMWPVVRDTFRPYVEPLFGWDEDVARWFFDKNWRKRRIVMVDGCDAGWLELASEARWLYINEIGLLPAYRNQGVGGQIISDVNAYADAHGFAVELAVLLNNPAIRLYERMGFHQTNIRMHRPARGTSAELTGRDQGET